MTATAHSSNLIPCCAPCKRTSLSPVTLTSQKRHPVHHDCRGRYRHNTPKACIALTPQHFRSETKLRCEEFSTTIDAKDGAALSTCRSLDSTNLLCTPSSSTCTADENSFERVQLLETWRTSELKQERIPPGSQSQLGKGLRHQIYVFWVLFFFAGSSLGAIFINKTCLTGYHFRYPLTLVLGQMLFAILLLSMLHVLGYRRIPVAGMKKLTTLAIPTALFTSNVVVGLSALSLVNIPMFSAFRRLTLLFVMAAEYVFLNKTHSRNIIYTVVVMTVGAFISAVDDVTFSRMGYCLVFLNNVLTAGYLAAIKRAMKETAFDPLTLLYYTALMGFPLVAMLLVSTGELEHVVVAFRTQPELGSWRFMASLILTATGAFAVNFSTSLCTHVTSPLTTSVAGQVKNVLQTVLGFFSWGFVPTMLNTLGLMIALGAQIWFAYLKFQEQYTEIRENNQDNGERCSNHE